MDGSKGGFTPSARRRMTTGRCTLLAGLILAFLLAGTPARAADASDDAVLRSAGLPTDGPGLLDFFRKRTLSDADVARLAETVRRLGHPLFFAREQASADLIAAGRSALPFLREAVTDRDPEVVRRAARCLEAIEGGREA